MTALGLVDLIATEAVRLEHAGQRMVDDRSDAGQVAQIHLIGRIHGLRWALCVVQGWDPVRDSELGGRSDAFLKNWHRLPGRCSVPGCEGR